MFLSAEHGEYNSAIILLENKEYISIFDLYVKEREHSIKIVNDEPVFQGGKITMVSSVVIKGERYYSTENTFRVLNMEITDGCELIGLCPYDLNKNYVDIEMLKNIEIPIKMTSIHVNTIMCKFRFSVFPICSHSKDSFTLGFDQHFQFNPAEALKVTEIREKLTQMTSLFSLLCGECVTINKLSLYQTDDMRKNSADYIGLCNFPKEKLNSLDNSGIDTTSYKRISIFKVSDFPNLEKSMNYWFDHCKELLNSQNAYSRILLDEEQKTVTTNKFLAAMQLIEGYTQAYVDKDRELADFEQQKKEIISKLDKKEGRELIESRLGLSGVSFRKAVKEYLYKGVSCLEQTSKNAFSKKIMG